MKQQAHSIIVNLLKSKNFLDCISKVNPESIREDLVSEVALILLEFKPEKIIALSNSNQLTFYVVRIVMNLAFSNTSPFYKKFRKHLVEYTENKLWEYTHDDSNKHYIKFKEFNIADDSEEMIGIKTQIEKVMHQIEREDQVYEVLDFYETEMLKLYMKYKTFREMEKVTHIPYVSCFHTVKKALIKIKNYIA